ncbi:hypothetical protein CYMTET_54919 [Cymbomonas tetramitiformis]|uniref:Uncharacterized protein n=1 Tax=Cymbomonas tetramitiformis TaxID=36881 RepID=A0AAE0BF34_9CHLO|nr:hypothetical protein CYMTET_54919 [Cymbomonas tetramitiformis]
MCCGDAFGGDVDGRGVDVQRMVNGDSGERHAVVEDADELSVADGQAKGPIVDKRRLAGEGVDQLDTAEWCAAGVRTGASGGRRAEAWVSGALLVRRRQ